jgi:hypothetical protein
MIDFSEGNGVRAPESSLMMQCGIVRKCLAGLRGTPPGIGGARAFLLAMLLSVALAGTAFAEDEAVDCSRFQDGPLRERQIYKSVALKVPYGEEEYAPLKIRYRPEYLMQPAFEGSGTDKPETTKLFFIDMQYGLPTKQESGEVELSARNHTGLVDDNASAPTWVDSVGSRWVEFKQK